MRVNPVRDRLRDDANFLCSLLKGLKNVFIEIIYQPNPDKLDSFQYTHGAQDPLEGYKYPQGINTFTK
jgi:hypothetical protein